MNKQWIVFFGEDWGRHHSTGQYLAKELADMGYSILWVDSLGLRAPRFNAEDIKRIFAKLGGFVFGRRKSSSEETSERHDNIHVITPIAIPLLKYKWVRWINRQILKRLFAKAYKAHHIVDPCVVTACPSTAVVLDCLPAKIKAYYCADEHASIAGMDTPLVQELEDKLLRQVDLVMVTARALEEQIKPKHARVYYLPHGVNYHHFAKAVNSHPEMPLALQVLAKPIIGFVGLIGEHIDLELLAYSAQHLPDYSFAMIGPVEVGIELPQAKNIIYLGPKPFSELPQYIAHFDVSILPYAYTRRNKFANPTKVREYLAAGSPVVCTNQQEAKSIDSAVYVADTAEQFVKEIENLITKKEAPPRDVISKTMQDQTWKARAEEMRSYLGLLSD